MPSRAHGRRELSWGLFGGTTWSAATSPVAEKQEWCFLVCSSGSPSYPLAWRLVLSSPGLPLTQCFEQPLVQTVLGRLSVMKAFGRIFSSTCLCRAVRTWKSGLFSLALVSFSSWVFGCCLWSTSYWIFREILRAPHLVRQWLLVLREALTNFNIFYVAVNSDPEAFGLHFSNGEVSTVDASSCSSLSAVRTLNLDIISTSSPWWR